jgi:two-component system, chemotaxis family, chemotaxis protein CheY
VKRCLIVDDSEIVRKVARVIVESLKFDVSEAATAQEALDACKPDMPDVIFLDWHLPGTNSIELIKGIRQLGVFKRPYIIYCMTEHDTDILDRATLAGIDDSIAKPFDRATLTAKFAGFKLAAA